MYESDLVGKIFWFETRNCYVIIVEELFCYYIKVVTSERGDTLILNKKNYWECVDEV